MITCSMIVVETQMQENTEYYWGLGHRVTFIECLLYNKNYPRCFL